MLMTEYETTMVMRPDLGGDAIETTLDRVREVVKTQGGKLISIDHWGKRKLAFEIKKQVRGVYVHAHFLGEKGLVAELERNLRISDNILRYETIRMARDVDATSRDEQAYVKPQYEAEEPAAREEAGVEAGGLLPVGEDLEEEAIEPDVDGDADLDVPARD
jgi:small subunit ribosomal protein S6